ncbi:Lmo0850 family protein [Peribacillus sp. FSL H8-0477]|uniref:Lmo0850 family protein n=1 Tax=Peribacillus sp. FSL H8-0477 TaxID=2921388 RepID=UPI0030F7965B
MGNEIINKFKNMGIQVEKTKSRHEIFSTVFRDDPEVLLSQTSFFSQQLACIKPDKRKISEL